MEYHISFDKYLQMLKRIANIKSSLMQYQAQDQQRINVENTADQYMNRISDAAAARARMRNDVRDTYRQVMSLLKMPAEAQPSNVEQLKDIHELEREINTFNGLTTGIVETGGTDPTAVKAFQTSYGKLCAYFRQCESNQFSEAAMTDVIRAGKERNLAEIKAKSDVLKAGMRRDLGMSDDDLKGHQKFMDPSESVYARGFRFPKNLANGIKLGTANIALTRQETEILHHVYPELRCKNEKLPVPYIFPINDDELSSKSNIYVEYDENDASELQAKIAVRQMILKILSESPLGELVLNCVDLTNDSVGGFTSMEGAFEDAIENITNHDIKNNLTGKLVFNTDVTKMLDDENENMVSNDRNRRSKTKHYLYIYFGYSPAIGSDGIAKIQRFFKYNGRGSAKFGVHNLIVVSKQEIADAKAAVKAQNANTSTTEAWLSTLALIQENSDCFSYNSDNYFTLMSNKGERPVNVELGDGKYDSIDDFEDDESRAIEKLAACDVKLGSPFLDLEGEDAYQRRDYVFAQLSDEGRDVSLPAKSHVAVVFADNSFSNIEKNRIMSSMLMSVLCSEPSGRARLMTMSGTKHITPVVNGLKQNIDGIQYTLLEQMDHLSTEDRLNRLKRIYEETASLMGNKRHYNRNYTFSDLLDEDQTRYVRVVYQEYSEEPGAGYMGSERNDLISRLQDAHENDCGIRGVLAMQSSNVPATLKKLENTGAYVIVAQNHAFTNAVGRKLKLSVLVAAEEAQYIAQNILNAYVKESVKSPSYEKIGFGKTCIEDVAEIGSSISIPVGLKDGVTLEMKFDCAGTLIGYMVQGTAGSGKSSLLFSLIYNGAMKYSPDALRFCLLDFKDGTSFDVFRNSKYPIPHVEQLSVQNDVDDANAIFDNIRQEMNIRSDLFKERNVKDIDAYNRSVKRTGGTYLPRIIVIIDECQRAFYVRGRYGDELNDSLIATFNEITRLMRSYGIHMVIATQEMSSTLAQKIGGQLQGRCSFSMGTVDAAMALLPEKSAAEQVKTLPKTGVMLFSTDAGKKVSRVQVAFEKDQAALSQKINRQYANYEQTTFEIGNTDALQTSFDRLPVASFFEEDRVECVSIPVAENCMKRALTSVVFRRKKNQALIIAGDNERLAANLMGVMLNGVSANSSTRLSLYTGSMNSMAASFCRQIRGNGVSVTTDLAKLLEEVYCEIRDRQDKLRQASFGEKVYLDPWCVALDGINQSSFEEPIRRPVRETNSFGSSGFALGASLESKKADVPDRGEVWRTICDEASEVGIYVTVYVNDPSRDLPTTKEYFSRFKHLIVLPGQQIKDAFQSQGILPMSGSDRAKYFVQSLKPQQHIAYYMTDYVSGQSRDKDGLDIFKIKPYTIKGV